MAPRSYPDYKPIEMQFGLPKWFEAQPEYDLFGEVAAIQNSQLEAKDRKLGNQRMQAQLEANAVFNDPTQVDPYAEASAILERSGMIGEADKLRNRKSDQMLEVANTAKKLDDAGFDELADKYLEERGVSPDAMKRKSKTELKEFDPEKDLYAISDGEIQLKRPGQKKQKEYAPKPVDVWEGPGGRIAVDRTNREEVERAIVGGYAPMKSGPADALSALLGGEVSKTREQAAAEREAKQKPIYVRRKQEQ